jgi:hypothetical protein
VQSVKKLAAMSYESIQGDPHWHHVTIFRNAIANSSIFALKLGEMSRLADAGAERDRR